MLLAMSRREIHSWLLDMDGVLVREEQPIPGADRFLAALRERGTPFLVLTNNSIYTRRDLTARLRASGLDVPEEAIWTSALATARFLEDQRPQGSAFVIGEAGLTTALHGAGYTLTERSPDYVVLGETRTYCFERITQAIRLIADGARFIATNPDATGPSSDGPLPATGSVAALISRATGVEPYFVGKPNPLMMRSALNAIDAHSEARGDDRRPHGHRHRGRNRGRHGDDPGADRRSRTREDAELHPYRAVANRRLGRRPDRNARLTPGGGIGDVHPNGARPPEGPRFEGHCARGGRLYEPRARARTRQRPLTACKSATFRPTRPAGRWPPAWEHGPEGVSARSEPGTKPATPIPVLYTRNHRET